MDGLSFVKVGKNGFAVDFLFGVRLTGAVRFQELLDAAVTGVGSGAAVLNHSVFGLDFLHQVGDLCG